MQSYLYDQNTSICEKISCFKWRTFMVEGYGENFRGGRGAISCPKCPLQHSHADSQEASYKACRFISKQLNLIEDYRSAFQDDVQHNHIKEKKKLL